MRCLWRFCILLGLLVGLEASASTTTYFHNDLTGSPLAASDSSGHVLWRESYRPYGERLVNSASAKGNDVWFTSRRQDAETGLVYMGARYYDPVAGRFASIDPKAFDESSAHSFNRYAYANNNPYAYFDPDGREPGNLYQRGYVPPTPQIFPEPGLIHPIPEAVLVPGIARLISNVATSNDGRLPNDRTAFVCRGGTCTADRFTEGSGVTVDASGKLNGVSVNSGAGKSVEELTAGIRNKQVGVTTVGKVEQAGGSVVPAPTPNNPSHCILCGISAKDAERLFTPTVRNPNIP
ncbi:MAG TPA: RHS repeat-associated core domain-containing protein [Usitatibacter sp.]|jgi:RHS repeat-associated protein|nr:RHS repeat-associated core domain-containing protein [Usitatibacter sp.]